ncbi:MAG: hypothetical protein QF583_07340, partial [Rhodospirillales bacterium]|nr:hypothetical protein [Rhodospirillales bacterium]
MAAWVFAGFPNFRPLPTHLGLGAFVGFAIVGFAIVGFDIVGFAISFLEKDTFPKLEAYFVDIADIKPDQDFIRISVHDSDDNAVGRHAARLHFAGKRAGPGHPEGLPDRQ